VSELEEELEKENNIPEKGKQRKLYIEKVDKSTSDLFRMIKEGELNLQPEYQRRIVWYLWRSARVMPTFCRCYRRNNHKGVDTNG
jgi:hypothetical protein